MSTTQPRPMARIDIEVMDDVMADILRQKTEAERLIIAWGMWRSARDMLRALIRAENPDASQEVVNRLAAQRLANGAN